MLASANNLSNVSTFPADVLNFRECQCKGKQESKQASEHCLRLRGTQHDASRRQDGDAASLNRKKEKNVLVNRVACKKGAMRRSAYMPQTIHRTHMHQAKKQKHCKGRCATTTKPTTVSAHADGRWDLTPVAFVRVCFAR